MLDQIMPVLMHTLAVVVSLGVAVLLINILGVDSPIVGAVLALLIVALEKLVRVKGSDWVNHR